MSAEGPEKSDNRTAAVELLASVLECFFSLRGAHLRGPLHDSRYCDSACETAPQVPNEDLQQTYELKSFWVEGK